MRGKKGFTLIELLAVLVLLAVISLISAPVVLGLIQNARREAAKNAAYGYVKALENSVAQSLVANPTGSVPGAVLVSVVDSAIIKGTAPTAISLNMNAGSVTSGTIVFNGFTMTFVAGAISSVNP
jgi:type IV pilus assembly protein PilA